MNSMRDSFLLNPDVVFLNHGSFGACPKPVFEVYQQWQKTLEQQPVSFLGRELDQLLLDSRQCLAGFLNTNAANLVYIPNATHGVNIVAASLRLKEGDEILSTDHEYGACEYAWEYWLGRSGAKFIKRPISLPLGSPQEFLDAFWQGVNSHTKAIYISHITSPTAMILPIKDLICRARSEGILTIVDGAHAPGQIPVDLDALGADFYTGNCHKWMLAPKGSAFLYARPDVQYLISPLVVSWGYHSTDQSTTGSRFIDYLQWSGTRDPAGALSVPAAIEFMKAHHWETVREECKSMVTTAVVKICRLVNLPNPYEISDFYAQMAIAPLPDHLNIASAKNELYDTYRIEVPLIEWNGKKFVRVSIQGYNTVEDVDLLVDALGKIIPAAK